MTKNYLMFFEAIDNGKFNQLSKEFENKEELNKFLDLMPDKFSNYKIISIYERIN